eukprot:10981900-Heterocapsa_arctica.AAC.1
MGDDRRSSPTALSSREGSPAAGGAWTAAEPEGGEARTSGGVAMPLLLPPTRIRRKPLQSRLGSPPRAAP